MIFNYKKLIIVITIFLYCTSTSLINSPRVHASLFNDDFETNISQWSPQSGIWNWQYIDGSFRYGSTHSSCCSESVAGNVLWNNYIYEFDLLGKQGVDKNAIFRYSAANSKYGIHMSGTHISLEKHTPTSDVDLTITNGDFTNNVVYHVKIEANNNNFKIYVDDVLYIDFTDNDSPLLTGKIGLRVGAGAVSPSQVWFDNVVVTEIVAETPTPTPTPTPTIAPTPTSTPTPTATPTVAPTPQPTFGPFELPFNYTGRLNSTNAQFKNAFWDKMRAVFDHTFKTGIFRPFTGNIYASCSDPISCYDSHNGVDFSKPSSDGFAYSVGTGKVIYRSLYPDCVTQGGYGCSVIIRYQGNLYGLYAHLNTITVNESQNVTSNTQIGEIGQTGAATGEHLHFGVLKPINDKLTSSAIQFMRNKDWKNLLDQISANIKPPKYNSYCTYKAPNGISFAFQDPLGWFGSDKDPWSLPKSKSGCGITSPYLWKYNVL